MRADAIRLAAKGFRVFPLAPGQKRPLRDGWQSVATSEAFRIFEAWPEGPANIGIATDGLVVVDADADKGGLDSLAKLGPLPETFRVRTARGGLHIYFRAPEGSEFANRVDAFKHEGLPGIDIRAAGGLVVGPGSTFEGKPYTLECDAAPAPLPDWLAERLRAAPQRTAERGAAVGPVDSPGAVQAASAWLLDAAPVAIEGNGGDLTTYQVAARVLDFGVSPETAADLMADHWNERCEPPWDFEELERKVANAAAYRQDAIGRDNPDIAGFGPIEPPPRRNTFADQVEPFELTAEQVAELPRRPWLVRRRLMRGKVTNLIAPGSAGKSLLSLQWASALAIGSGEFTGLDLCERVNALVINNEDEKLELKLRLGAVFQYFQLPYADARGRLFLYSGIVEKFKAVVRNRSKLERSQAFADLVEFVTDRAIGLVVFDTLVSIHEADENSNSEMQIVMEALTSLAAATNCAVLVVHHTTKPPQASSDSYAGSMNVGRGASAVVNAARVQLTLFGMSEKDGEKYGIPAHIRHRYVRLDDAKANLYLASDAPDWFEKASVKLPNGEELGVLNPVQLARQDEAQMQAAIELLARSGGSRWPVKTAAKLIGADPMFSGRGEHALISLLIEAFAGGERRVGSATLSLTRDGTKRGGTIELFSLD